MPGTGFRYASSSVAASVVVVASSASSDEGTATTDDFDADGAPGTKVTVAVADCSAPKVAVTVFVSAFVDFSVTEHAPAASVERLANENVSPVPVASKFTVAPPTGFPYRSRRVAATVAVAVSSATRLVGSADSDDFAETGAPAVNVTFVSSDSPPPNDAVTVFSSALVLASVIDAVPAVPVVAVEDERVFAVPVTENVTVWPGAGLPWASLSTMARTDAAVPSATSVEGDAESVERGEPAGAPGRNVAYGVRGRLGSLGG